MPPLQTGSGIVEKTMAHLLPAKFDGPQARVMLLAIGLQESDFVNRSQIGGPARSYWGFEQGGGIQGVLQHPASKGYARAFCGLRAVAPVASDVYAAFLADDVLACAFARLLLWTDAAALPTLGDRRASWEYYHRNWRPGAYDRGDAAQQQAIRDRWDENFVDALNLVLCTWRATV